MRIGVLTFHRSYNYGATLQMYALQKCIKELSPSTEITVIDYYGRAVNKGKKNGLKSFVSHILRKLIKQLRIHRFNQFIKRNIAVSVKVYTDENFHDLATDYDVLVVGSDQIWNTKLTNEDMHYFFDGIETVPKYSYAASIGLYDYPEEIKSYISQNLSTFREISVREKSGKSLIDKMCGSECCRVDVDPTLLLDASQWQCLCRKKRSRRYVFVYTVVFSKQILEEASQFAKERNLEVIYVGQYHKTPGVKYILYPHIEELLSLFYYADYVFVNSFHGTVFSILFHKQFYSKLELQDGRNSRITNLLSMTGLDSRTNLTEMCNNINWDSVDQILQLQQKESIEYINRIISDGNK